MSASVLGVGLTTPVGLHAIATFAAIRAGIPRIRQYAFDPLNEPPAPLGWLDERHLAALRPGCAPIDERSARLVRLAAPALAEALTGAVGPTTLLLALPDRRSPRDRPDDHDFFAALSYQADVEIALPASRVLRCGRAGGLLALELALTILSRDPSTRVCVGGVDSHFDPSILAGLSAAGRLHGEGNRDGFIPGEAAAFVALGRAPGPGVRVVAAAQARTTPLREGVSHAVQALLASAGPAPIQHIYSGATGESLWAREWGIAAMRSAERFAADVRVDHPAEFIGDPGAALGPLLLGLAAIAVERGHRGAPCLVWCGSDRGERAAALLDHPTERF